MKKYAVIREGSYWGYVYHDKEIALNSMAVGSLHGIREIVVEFEDKEDKYDDFITLGNLNKLPHRTIFDGGVFMALFGIKPKQEVNNE